MTVFGVFLFLVITVLVLWRVLKGVRRKKLEKELYEIHEKQKVYEDKAKISIKEADDARKTIDALTNRVDSSTYIKRRNRT